MATSVVAEDQKQVTAWRQLFFYVHPCSATTSEHLENGIGRGVTKCMTCTEAVNIVGFSLLERCAELRAQERRHKSARSCETCAIMFIKGERSVRKAFGLTLSPWLKHFRSLISRFMSLRYAVVSLRDFFHALAFSHDCTHGSADNTRIMSTWEDQQMCNEIVSLRAVSHGTA